MKVLILSYSSTIIFDAGNPCIPLSDESEFGDYSIRHHLEKQCRLTKTIKVFLILLIDSLNLGLKYFHQTFLNWPKRTACLYICL